MEKWDESVPENQPVLVHSLGQLKYPEAIRKAIYTTNAIESKSMHGWVLTSYVMNIEGRLNITLTLRQGNNGRPGLHCNIDSSRPLHISQLFVGKPVQHLLKTVPLLFNICGMAQATAATRATEQALGVTASPQTEQQRDILVTLESLREQSQQLISSSAAALQTATDQQTLAQLFRTVQTLSRHLHNPAAGQHLFILQASASEADQAAMLQHWHTLKKLLEKKVFSTAYTRWLDADITTVPITHSRIQATQPLQFLNWLNQQDWADSGQSQIITLPADTPATDAELLRRFNSEAIQFTSQPDWKGQVREVSNFSLLQNQPLVRQLINQRGNGLYTRIVARLLSIALLMAKLEQYFIATEPMPPSVSTIPQQNLTGLAHVNAARGKLTHHIVLAADQETVQQFNILAPTEWNFHPQGVAVQSLENLMLNRPDTLEQQARRLIDAIDPCVGYDLVLRHEVADHA